MRSFRQRLTKLTLRFDLQCKRFAQYSLIFILCASLVITPQLVMAANIILLSGLKHLEMDLGTAVLTVDEIDSNVQLTVMPSGALNVKSFRAKKITLTMKPALPGAQPNPADKKAMAAGTLPETIHLPLPIILEQGQVEEMVIVRGLQRDVLENIQFNLAANPETIALGLSVDKSPWGVLDTRINIENQKPFNLLGNMHLVQKETAFQYDVSAKLFGSLQKIQFSTRNQLIQEKGNLALLAAPDADNTAVQTNLKEDITTIQTDGFLSLEDEYPLGFHMQVRQFDPAILHGQLLGRVNLNLTATGALAPQSQLVVHMDTENSQIRGQALTINADATVLNGALEKLTSNGKLGNNTFSVTGGADVNMAGSLNENNHASDNQTRATNIAWQADFNDISALGSAFSGEMHTTGNVLAYDTHTVIRYALSGKKIALPNQLSMESLAAEGEISTAEDGIVASKLAFIGFSQHDALATDYQLIDAKVNVTGTQKAHRLTLNVTNTNAADQAIGLIAQIDGGMRHTEAFSGWQGALTQLKSLDERTIQLNAPAPMQFSKAGGFRLEAFALNIKQGLLAIDTLVLNQQLPTPQLLHSRGRIENLSVQDVQDYLFLDHQRLKNNLIMAGDWQVTVDDKVNANMTLKRTSGDVVLQSNGLANVQSTTLGMQALDFSLLVEDNALHMQTEIAAKAVGYMRGDFKTTVSKDGNRFGIAADTPLSLALSADLKTLAWLPLPNNDLTADADIDGAIQLQVSADGTMNAPNLQGYVNANQLKVNVPSAGVALSNGEMAATFSQQVLAIKTLKFDGGKGYVSAVGHADFSDAATKLNLNIQTHDFTALSRTDRVLVVAGQSEIKLANNALTLNGKLKVLRGLFELPKQGMPSLSDDVIVIGLEKPVVKTPIAINIGALTIDFGEQPLPSYFEADEFILRGSGINGALSGAITLSGNPTEQLRASGSLNIIGTYMAYGQQLDIESGQINFSGPISNAGLNIVAMRNMQPTKAGVKIAGTVLVPTLKLISSPEVPDGDKLSLLIIGQPMSEVGNSELALLSVAAGALLSDGESVPLQTRIANSAGLDALNVTGSDASSYAVSVGKRISNNLYLGYEKSLFGLLNVAKLTYRLTQRVSVETRAGSESAVDLLYSFNFD